jgi:serine/threonine protein kinase
MLENQTLWRTTAEAAPGTLRWMAPELLEGTEVAVSRRADIYAYGMTALV